MRYCFLVLFILFQVLQMEGGKYVYIPRSWMQIDELLNETEKQAGVEIENLITDSKKKMVLYDSMTGLEEIVDAAVEYYEYVLRVDVEVLREGNKIIIRKPFFREVKEKEPHIVSSWPEPVTFSERGQHEDLLLPPKNKLEKKRSVWSKLLGGLNLKRNSGSRAISEEGQVVVDGESQGFRMSPGSSGQAGNYEGWNEDRIDSLFKPRRVIDPILSSSIDEIVNIGEDEGIMDLETLPETKIADFDSPGDDFVLRSQSVYEEEVLPSHPKDPNRKPKWILSLSPEKWKLKLERYKHPEEKPNPVSRRVEKRRTSSSRFFNKQRDAYVKRRYEEDQNAPRREKR